MMRSKSEAARCVLRLASPPALWFHRHLPSLTAPLALTLQAVKVNSKTAKGFTDHNKKWLKPKAPIAEEPSSDDGDDMPDSDAAPSLSGEEFSSDGGSLQGDTDESEGDDETSASDDEYGTPGSRLPPNKGVHMIEICKL
jgi:hypothetical protein